MGAEAERFAMATTHRTVSWRNGLAIWLIVALATWFQSERGMVSLAPLLLCTVLVAVDGLYCRLTSDGAKVIDLTIDDDKIVLHLGGALRGAATGASVLDDLVAGPENRRSTVGPGRGTVLIEHTDRSAVLAVEFVVAATGLGLVQSSRRQTIVASPPVQRGSEANLQSGVRLPVDDSLRAYQFGDSMRRVHWPTTARTGSLRVRAVDYTANVPVFVVVERQADTDRDGWEDVVERTVSLIGAALSSGRTVHLAYRTVDLSADGPLYTSILRDGISAALEELDGFEPTSEMRSRQIVDIGDVRASLAAAVPGTVDVIDEHEVRVS